MSEPLKEPPLIEAICELRFVKNPFDDVELVEGLCRRLANDFPQRTDVPVTLVNVALARDAAPNISTPNGSRVVQLKRADASAMAQLAPRALVVNHLRPYASWPQFRGLITDVVKAFRELAPAMTHEQIGLRYINFHALPAVAADVRVQDWLRVAPPTGAPLDRAMRGYLQRYEMVVEDPPATTFIHQVGTALLPDRAFGIMLDLDFSSATPAVDSAEQLVAWLDRAHAAISDAFVRSITDSAYTRFKEGA